MRKILLEGLPKQGIPERQRDIRLEVAQRVTRIVVLAFEAQPKKNTMIA